MHSWTAAVTLPAQANFKFWMLHFTEAELTDSSDPIHQNGLHGDVPSCFLTQKPRGLNDVIPELEA